MKPSQHELETRMVELRNGLSECRSNLRLQESFLKEDLKTLQIAQITYNRRLNAIMEEKKMYGLLDRELAEIDGRLQEYTLSGRPKGVRAPKPPTVEEAVAVLKGLHPEVLARLLNK